MRPPRRFGNPFKEEPTITVQGTRDVRARERVSLHEPIVAMAEAEYERQYGSGPADQTADELRERGGLSVGEVIKHLAEALVRYAPSEALVPESRRISSRT